MSVELFRISDGRLSVVRYAESLREGYRYQFTMLGETDNCGKRYAWSSLDREEIRRLAAILALEADI